MVLKLRNSSNGIGDQVCGLYACQALKDRYPEATVEYYSKTHEWLTDVESIVAKPYSHYFVNPPAQVDLYIDSAIKDYKNQSRCRKKIYTDRIGLHDLKPRVPIMRRLYSFEGEYILLVPFAAWKDREWPIEKWVKLEKLLLEAGYSVRILGQSNRNEILLFTSQKIIDYPPHDVINIILNSKCVVVNDSGMAHVAGLYEVPTVSVISGHFGREHLFSETDIVGILPKEIKISNSLLFKKKSNTSTTKSGLDSIEPQTVYNEIIRLIDLQLEMSKLFGTITLI